MHRCKSNDVLTLNVERFCGEMITAVKLWITETKSDKNIQERIAEMARIETGRFQPIPGVLYGP